jgi:hypothetical protein
MILASLRRSKDQVARGEATDAAAFIAEERAKFLAQFPEFADEGEHADRQRTNLDHTPQ